MSYTRNNADVIGNLTRDAELTYTQGGKTLLKFGLAVNERYQDAQGNWKDGDPLFLDVVMWGAQGEKLAPLMTKGKPCFAAGKLKLDTWDDKESGKKRSKIYLNAFNVEVLQRPPREQQQGGGDEGGEEQAPRQQQARQAPQGRPQPQQRTQPAARGGAQQGGMFSAGLEEEPGI